MLTMATDAKHISINLYPIIYSGWLNTILNNLKLLVQNLGRESWSVLSCKCAKLSKGQGRRTHSPPVHFFKWRKSKERFQEEPSLFLIDVTRGVRGGELKKKKKKNTHEDEAMQSEWVRELVPGLSDVFLSKKVCSRSVSQTEKWGDRLPTTPTIKGFWCTNILCSRTTNTWRRFMSLKLEVSPRYANDSAVNFFDSQAVKFRYFNFQKERMTTPTPTQHIILPPPQKVYGRYPLNAECRNQSTFLASLRTRA